MTTALVTGSYGLVGSTIATQLVQEGWKVVGIDCDMRRKFFGPEASVAGMGMLLRDKLGHLYQHIFGDVCQLTTWDSLDRLLDYDEVTLVVHCASQPSHDYSAMHPIQDFDINARATLILLEWVRTHCPHALVVYMSTNKVYGDHINEYEFHESAFRWYPTAPHLEQGVDEDFPLDKSLHSPFGVSKAAGDLLVQEYGRYHGMKTVCLRCGCITGGAHQGAKLHGFLAYLVKCLAEDIHYTVIGHKGKQVRDQLHAFDLAMAVLAIYRSGADPHGEVFNMGGGPDNSVSILEAIYHICRVSGKSLSYQFEKEARKGDHIWWVTDTRKFHQWFPDWSITITLPEIFQELLARRVSHDG